MVMIMMRFSSMIERIQGQLLDESSDTETMIKSWINDVVDFLCRTVDLPIYRLQRTITPDSSGYIYLPGILQSIKTITDSTKVYHFKHEDVTEGLTNERKMEYLYSDHGIKDSYDYSETAVVVNGSANVTVSAGTSAEQYDTVSFSSEDGFYEVVSGSGTAVVLLDEYRGTAGSKTMLVNPSGMRKVKVYDSNGSAYTSDVIVTFQRKPHVLVSDNDIIWLDAPSSIFYNVLKRAYERGKYQTDSLYLDNQIKYYTHIELGSLKRGKEKTQMEQTSRNMGMFSLHRRRG